MLKEMEDKRKWISDKLIQYVDILFGVVVGQSIIKYIDLIRNPTLYPFAFIALIVVIITVTLSWIGYHKSLYKYPYTAEILTIKRVLRPFNDFLIVVLYTLFLFKIEDFKKVPDQINIYTFILCFAGIFFLYITDGFIRVKEYKDHGASMLSLSTKFFAAYSVLGIIYLIVIKYLLSYIVIINWSILLICLSLYIFYRIQREPRYPEVKSAPLIVVDVDGVLADQVTPILESINKKFGSKYIKSDIRSWDQPLPLAKTDIKIAIESSHVDPSYIASMKPIQDAQKVISELSRYFEITIATNRTPVADKPSKQWLRKNNIPYDHYINTSVMGKGAAKGKLLIDDYPNNIVDFLSAEEGRIALLFSQPWNEDDQSLIGKDNVYRVHGWKEVMEKIRSLL